jgi:hypothetical protein
MEVLLRQFPNNDWVFFYLLISLFILVIIKKGGEMEVILQGFKNLLFIDTNNLFILKSQKPERLTSLAVSLLLPINWAILITASFQFDFLFFLFIFILLLVMELASRFTFYFLTYIFSEKSMFPSVYNKKIFYDQGVLFISFVFILIYHFTNITKFFDEWELLIPVVFIYIYYKIRAIYAIYTSANIQVTYIFLYLCILEITPFFWCYFIWQHFLM